MNVTISTSKGRIDKSAADVSQPAAKDGVSSEQAKPEYSVYIHHHNEDGAPQQWERKHSTHVVDQAIKRAKILYKSDKYAKVEVKKVELDSRKDQTVERSCKVYEGSMLSKRAVKNAVKFGLITLGATLLSVFLYFVLVQEL